MNAIELLKQQHEKTRDALEEMSSGNVDPQELRLLADELVAHMVIEEHVFYPRMRELMSDMVGESFEEHAVARFELARVLIASGEDQKTRATVLKELVMHHVEEEEKDMFPKVLAQVPASELEALGARMEAMFEKAVEAGFESLVSQGGELRRESPRRASGTHVRASARTQNPRSRAATR